MKNIIKRLFFYLILLSNLIINAGPGDPCPLAVLVNDLSTSSADFKVLIKETNGFNAWLILNNEASSLRTNIEELTLVSKNLDNINKVGGYVKWKSLSGVGEKFDNLLKNTSYNSIYEPLKNGSHIRKYANYNISIAEEAAYKLFIQDNYYSNFNKALSGVISMTPEYTEMKDLMLSAYSKFPKQIGINVFRGAGASESNFAKKLVKGQKFNFEGRFTSSSLDDYTADIFRRGNKGDVIWEIESKTGVDLKLINGSESEILFKPFAQFEVVDILPSTTTPNVFIYKIKEL
ncbi:ADP-ribosyltransferase domain-containing protein [Flavobacterium chilense]|uniref:NAD(+)--protein-arginine ADP-ribosyltransferase n=1 Tax=Flavobacterium chilense TaxID=946677 RepID=A0A1M6YJM8_9FLAO|nr:ADP-ribosyltransferase domain-containing protein [Flavobacterium chilense]SHL18219.1 NAD:arginine ADP-ribosyltransferase [Flavobacterium chilense]